jgi:hypothetical protein
MHDLMRDRGLFVGFARGTDARTPGLTDQDSDCQYPTSFCFWFTLTMRHAPQGQTCLTVAQPCARGFGRFESTGPAKHLLMNVFGL